MKMNSKIGIQYSEWEGKRIFAGGKNAAARPPSIHHHLFSFIALTHPFFVLLLSLTRSFEDEDKND